MTGEKRTETRTGANTPCIPYTVRIKKPVGTCAKSIVAAVHINSRITLRTPTHIDRTVLAQPSVHKERRAAKAWCAVQQ